MLVRREKLIKNNSEFSKSGFKVPLLYIGIVFLYISDIFQNCVMFQNFVLISDLSKYIAIAIMLLVFFLKKNSISQRAFWGLVILGGLMLYTSYTIGNYSLFCTIMLVVSSGKIKINRIVDFLFKCMVVENIFVIFLWFMNWIFGLGYDVFYSGDITRIAFCYTHPNRAAVRLIWMLIAYMWVHWETIKIRQGFVLIILGLTISLTTKSDAIYFYFLGILLLAVKKSKIITKTCNFIARYAFVVIGFVSIALAEMYMLGGKVSLIISALNLMSSQRIGMNYLAIKNNGFTLLGQPLIVEHSWEKYFQYDMYTVDNLYILMFCNLGIFYFLLLSYCFYRLACKNVFKISVMIILFSFYSFIESSCIYINICFVMLLFKIMFEKEDNYRSPLIK